MNSNGNRRQRGRPAPVRLRCLLLLAALLAPGEVAAAPEGRPMRLADSLALTPDGATLVLSWRGDLWRVPAAGGNARRLTVHPAEDRSPWISPDGTLVAFLSNRSGTDQVHVMSLAGGPARQVTLHSEGARPCGWFPDGESLLIRSRRDHQWRGSDRFFRKPLTLEEAPVLLFDAAVGHGTLSPDGRTVAFTREGMAWWRKGYRGSKAAQIWLCDLETGAFRKLTRGDHGAMWPCWGAGGAGGASLFYVSEADGTWNLWRHDLASNERVRVTSYSDDGVCKPAISADGRTIVFRHLFDTHSLSTAADAVPTRLTIVDAGDPGADPVERRTLAKATDVAFTDDAREIAFVAGGDLWVMDTELREPRRITNTPAGERDPVFTRDFERLIFVSDAAGQPDIWEATRADPQRHWWQNVEFKVRRLTDDAADERDLALTPDGKHVAFVRGQGDLWLMGPGGEAPRRIVASFSAPDYCFSPDSRWVAYAKPDDDFNWDVWIQALEGSDEPVNVSMHPDYDGDPAWSPDGKLLAFTGRRWKDESDICTVWLRREDDETGARDRALEKALEKMKARKGKGAAPAATPATAPEPAAASATTPPDPLAGTWRGSLQGPPPLPEDGLDLVLEIARDAQGEPTCTVDVVGQFSGTATALTFNTASGRITFSLDTPLGPLSGEGTATGDRMEGSWRIAGQIEGTFAVARDAAPDAPPEAPPHAASAQGKTEKPQPVEIDFEDIAERVQRVRIPDARERGLLWSPDSKRLAFHATVNGAAGLYTIAPPEDLKPKRVTATQGSHARWLAEGNQIAWLVSGVPASLTPAGKLTRFPFSVRQEVFRPALYEAVFDRAWYLMREGFYDERLGNRDWDAVRAKYRPMAGSSHTPREIETVVNMMLGELNGSHLGFRVLGAAWKPSGWRDVTGHLGARWDPAWEGPGLRVAEVIRGTPAAQARHRLAPGDLVLAVDGRPVGPATHLDRLLTGDPSRTVEVRVRDAEGRERTLRMRPTSYAAVRRRLYDHGVRATRAAVAAAGKGRLGYLHVRGMNWSNFEQFEAELYKIGHGRDGLIVDVRDNGGGFTTDHLLTCLTQPRHALTVPRGGGPGYPQDRMVYAAWHKPIVVLCNQNSFSNAEIFAHAVKSLGRGPVVGVTTAGGVISTGVTTVLAVGTLRLPFRGWFLLETGADMELNGCVPDHEVWPEPGDRGRGIDRQLDKAVEILQLEIERWRQRPRPALEPASAREQ